MQRLESKESDYLYIMKAFAIFSVVCAHTAPRPENCSQSVYMITKILDAAGTMGVPIFFIISGYLYFGNQHELKDFWRRKCKTIIVPWIFCESMVWLYVVLRKGGITFGAWIKWIVGMQNTTYYLTILMLFYVLFWKIKNCESILMGSMVVSCICLVGLGWDMPWAVQLNKLTFTPYLNAFNWMIYFVSGILLKKKNYFGALAIFAKKILPVSIFLLIIDFGIHSYYLEAWTYFSRYALLNIILQVLVVMGSCYRLCEKRAGGLITVGKYSYAIYLLHGLIAGGCVWLTARIGNSILILARPVMVILLVLFGIWIVQKVCERLKWLRDIPKVLIGIR